MSPREYWERVESGYYNNKYPRPVYPRAVLVSKVSSDEDKAKLSQYQTDIKKYYEEVDSWVTENNRLAREHDDDLAAVTIQLNAGNSSISAYSIERF